MKKLVLMLCMAIFLSLSMTHLANAAKQVNGTVNINTASAEQLSVIPGIGMSKAQSIIEQRQKQKFRSVEELVLVKGIGEKLLQKVAPYVSVTGENNIKYVKSDSDAKSKKR